MKASTKRDLPIVFYLKCLLLSYVLTIGLLLLLAFLLYRFGLSEGIVSAAIVLIYVFATLFAGYISGKKMKNRKFVWGLLAGILYFCVLLLVSFFLDHGTSGISGNPVTVFVICACSGMLGGMLS